VITPRKNVILYYSFYKYCQRILKNLFVPLRYEDDSVRSFTRYYDDTSISERIVFNLQFINYKNDTDGQSKMELVVHMDIWLSTVQVSPIWRSRNVTWQGWVRSHNVPHFNYSYNPKVSSLFTIQNYESNLKIHQLLQKWNS